MPSDNVLIEAAGNPRIYLLRQGQKYYIQTSRWISDHGYAGDAVHVLQASTLAAIPSGYDLREQSPIPGTPGALEGELVSAQGKIYVVEHGVRHWVLNSRWLAAHGYAGRAPIALSDSELQTLPLGVAFDYIAPERIFETLALTLGFFTFLLIAANPHYRRFWTSLPQVNRHKFHQWCKTWQFSALLFIFFLAAMIAREPILLAHPRFWAEEGTVWFSYGSSHSLLQTLFFVFPASTYLALTANIGAVLSSLTAARAGLEYAPLATTLLALLVQALPIALILFGHSPLFNSLWRRVAGCSIVIFASTATDEIWLNSINCMSFLGLTSLLLLFDETWNWPHWMRWSSGAILLLCGLSSPYSCALLPLFLLSAHHEKRRERKIQCLILIFCALVQVGIVARTRIHLARAAVAAQTAPGVGLSGRGKELRLDVGLVDVFFGQVALPVLGPSVREDLIGEMGLEEAWITASSFPPRPASRSLQAGAWLCFFLLAAILWRLRGIALWGVTNVLIAAFLTFACFTCVASLHEVPLGRYAFLPGLTFLLVLLVNIDSATSQAVCTISALLLSFGLAVGILSYRVPQVENGPSWSNEVRLWQSDHSHELQVWPSGWRFAYRPPKKP